jgi:hypothetical protein
MNAMTDENDLRRLICSIKRHGAELAAGVL